MTEKSEDRKNRYSMMAENFGTEVFEIGLKRSKERELEMLNFENTSPSLENYASFKAGDTPTARISAHVVVEILAAKRSKELFQKEEILLAKAYAKVSNQHAKLAEEEAKDCTKEQKAFYAEARLAAKKILPPDFDKE